MKLFVKSHKASTDRTSASYTSLPPNGRNHQGQKKKKLEDQLVRKGRPGSSALPALPNPQAPAGPSWSGAGPSCTWRIPACCLRILCHLRQPCGSLHSSGHPTCSRTPPLSSPLSSTCILFHWGLSIRAPGTRHSESFSSCKIRLPT